MERGYLQNSEWRFDGAENDFRALLAASRAEGQSPSERAIAMLNLALNISNDGRFEEADAAFAQADAYVAASGDPDVKAEALTYRAYHLRNQRGFKDAAGLAEQALAIRARAETQAASGRPETVAAFAPRSSGPAPAAGGPIVIDEAMSRALNVRTKQSALTEDEVTPATKLILEDVQTLEIEGSSKLALRDFRGAEETLQLARSRLAAAEEQGATSAQLKARINADLGDLAVATGRPEAAISLYQEALKLIASRHAGSAPVGALLMDLGHAQILANQNEAAFASYDEAFAVFKTARGSLGASADGAAPYLDLLLALERTDPARAPLYADRYFKAVEAVVSDQTSAAISRLAARVASGDDITAGLVRAVDDTRREIRSTEGRIAALEAQGAYQGPTKASAEADLAKLKAQLAAVNGALLEANPRYQQLVASTATLTDIQKALRADEVYVKTLLLGRKSYGILVSKTDAQPYAIEVGRSEITATASALRAPMEGAGEALEPFDVSAAHALFETLFGPVADKLLRARHLVYEPDVDLLSLPAAVFVIDQASVDLMKARRAAPQGGEDYRGVAWLGDRLDSALALSAVSFLQSRSFKPSRAARPYLAFADPKLARTEERAYARFLSQGEARLERSTDPQRAQRICGASRRGLLKLEDLPDTGEEARIVAASLGAGAGEVVTGPEFTDRSVRDRKDLASYKVLYFATHALLPMPDACLPEPALLTSVSPSGSEGLLPASDIVKLKLDADLVVLSACDTGGSGSDDGLASGGEALGGLTRAFIYAGARGLIVSHWSVDSAATEKLMTGLFEAVVSNPGRIANPVTVDGGSSLATPAAADLFLTVVGSSGQSLTGSLVVSSGAVQLVDPTTGNYRINGCVVTDPAACTSITDAIVSSVTSPASAPAAAGTPTPALNLGLATFEDDDVWRKRQKKTAAADQAITGIGNEEIWRR